MPADGIYAGRMMRSATGDVLPSAVYVGKRPTFYDDRAMTLLEVHALDFSGDLYGQDVAVRFTHRIRGEPGSSRWRSCRRSCGWTATTRPGCSRRLPSGLSSADAVRV